MAPNPKRRRLYSGWLAAPHSASLPREPACRSATCGHPHTAALHRGRTVGAGRPAHRQRRLGPHCRPRRRRRLLPPGPQARLRRDQPPDRRRQARRCRDRLRDAAQQRQGRRCRRARVPQHARAEHAVSRQHPALCRDRARALRAAQAGHGRRRNRHQRAESGGSRHQADPRRGRDQGLPDRRRGRARTPGFPGDPAAADQGRRAHPGTVRARRSLGRHRRADRFHRPRLEDVGLPAGRSRDRRRPAGDGQDLLRAQRRRARRRSTRACRWPCSRWRWGRRSSPCGC